MKAVLVAAMLAAGTGSAYGQSTVTGRILGGDSAFVVAAHLQLFDTAGQLRAETISDSAGSFRLHIVRNALPGRFYLSVQSLGYLPVERVPLSIGKSEAISTWVRMNPSAVLLQPIRVVARRRYRRGPADEFYERADELRKGGLGHAIYAETLAKLPGTASALDAILRVPSVRYTTIYQQGRAIETVTMRGNCLPEVYLDRLHVDAETLTRLDPTQLEGIVVYTGAMEIPAEYRNQTDCGVIVAYSTNPPRAGRGLTIPGILIGGAFIAMLILS